MKHLIIAALCLGGLLPARAQSIGAVSVYKHFAPAGTTAGLWHTLHHPADYGAAVDTTNINVPPVLAPADFQQLLATARKRKHSPTKITGIRFAGAMLVDKDQHFYLYCGPTLLIDLTAKLNYELAAASASTFDAKAALLPHQN